MTLPNQPDTSVDYPPAAHLFKNDFAKALLKALGLEGHKVFRVEMTFDIRQAAQIKVFEYSRLDRSMEVVRLLEMADWCQDVTSATDPIAQHITPHPETGA